MRSKRAVDLWRSTRIGFAKSRRSVHWETGTRRCQRLRKHAHRGENGEWRRWSIAVDEQAKLLERIARASAHDLGGVLVKVQAVVWELLDDDIVLDEGARRRVAALGRELRRLAKPGNQADPGTHKAGGLPSAE